MIENLLLRFPQQYKEWEEWTTREGRELLIYDMQDGHLKNSIFYFKKAWLNDKYREKWKGHWKSALRKINEEIRDFEFDLCRNSWAIGYIADAAYGNEYDFIEMNLKLSMNDSIFCLPYFVIMLAEVKKRNLNLQKLHNSQKY